MSKEPSGPIVAIDPGSDKCGLAVVQPDGSVMEQSVIASSEVAGEIERVVGQYGIKVLVLGDRTTAGKVKNQLEQAGISLETVMVDEHRSTEQARRRYFQDHPPRGWRRLLPLSLQTPPRLYDDCVAVILAERYFSR